MSDLSSQDSGDSNTSRIRRFLSWLWLKIKENLVGAILGVVLTALFAALIAIIPQSGSIISTFAHDQIAGAIVRIIDEDLKHPDTSKILGQFRDAIKTDLQSKKGDLTDSIDAIYDARMTDRFDKMFGEMTVGLLILTENNTQGFVHVFDPPAHNGTLFIKIVNLPGGALVSLQGPRGVPKKLTQAGEFKLFINEDGINDQKSSQKSESGDIIQPESKYFRDMYTITVKLIPASASLTKVERPRSDAAVVVKYIAVVYPPLDTGALQ